ncbi:MAG: ABC transporter ATP-binding protein [Bacillota bacterium]|nr:MAG: ABC transporter ATP-binding protein [Bacillota bacterium]
MSFVPLLELRGIGREYRIGQIRVNALKDIDLDVSHGEFVSVMGPSGCGKSTLLNIIGCLDLPTSGTYRLAGQSVQDLDDSELSDLRNRFIGFIFQTFHLLPHFTAQANVELPLVYRGVSKKERRERALAALEAVGLADRSRHFPLQMSGGEQQRTAIARALVGQPSVILADEPTGALDSRSGLTVMSTFERLNREQGLTIVQVSHDETVARYARRIVRLLDGSIEREEEVVGLRGA